MNPVLAWTIAGVIVSAFVGLVIPGAAALVKFGRMLEQINHQVTRNGGQNNPPTIPDKLGELRTELAGAREDVTEIKDDVKNLQSWSETENRRIWRELSRKQDRP